MKPVILTTVFLLTALAGLKAQVFVLPDYDKRSHKHVDIIAIQVTDEHTLVRCRYVVQDDYNPLFEQLTIFMKQETFIRDRATGRLYQLMDTRNIPIEPGRRLLQRPGQVVEFDLIFPPIPKTIKQIDIFEHTAEQGFNFYSIILEPVA